MVFEAVLPCKSRATASSHLSSAVSELIGISREHLCLQRVRGNTHASPERIAILHFEVLDEVCVLVSRDVLLARKRPEAVATLILSERYGVWILFAVDPLVVYLPHSG